MGRPNAFDRILRRQGRVADVEILGGPAAAQEGAPDAQVRYAQKDYSHFDEIMIGIGGATPLAAGATADFTAQVSSPCKVKQVCIPSDVAPSLLINNIKIGPFNLVDGAAIAADVYSEVSLVNQVDWPEVQTSQSIVFNLTNTGAAAVTPRITLRVIRLR